jgi:hypothetical protein
VFDLFECGHNDCALKCLAVCSLKLEVTLLPPNLRKSGSQLRFYAKPQTAFHLVLSAARAIDHK